MGSRSCFSTLWGWGPLVSVPLVGVVMVPWGGIGRLGSPILYWSTSLVVRVFPPLDPFWDQIGIVRVPEWAYSPLDFCYSSSLLGKR
jgi:hypothetical protein